MSTKLKTPASPDALLTAEQVAHRLGFKDTDAVNRLARQGILPAIRLNARVQRFRPEDVDQFIESRRTDKRRRR